MKNVILKVIRETFLYQNSRILKDRKLKKGELLL